jgi:hypothetical protein
LERRASHEDHSVQVICTLLVIERQPRTRRSSTLIMPVSFATRIALLAVLSLTPASPAMWPMARVQFPLFKTNIAITARHAISPWVNRAASRGGTYPDAAQRRRRSMLASDRGRDPIHFRVAGVGAGTALRASISWERSFASVSLILPAAKARQTSADNSVSVERGAASRARRISCACTCTSGP